MPLPLSVAIRVLLGASLALALLVNPARAADPAKTLRVAKRLESAIIAACP